MRDFGGKGDERNSRTEHPQPPAPQKPGGGSIPQHQSQSTRESHDLASSGQFAIYATYFSRFGPHKGADMKR
jgi:hypothetical protein